MWLAKNMNCSINPDKVVETIEKLGRRIDERFPSSGLGKVCHDLGMAANTNKMRVEWIARPNFFLRFFVYVIIALSLITLVYSVSLMDISIRSLDAGELVQITEAGLNNLVLIGAAIFFLVTMETKVKRSRALEALHELRSIAHVIDMHQLTKDPSKLAKDMILTPSSPKVEMTVYGLIRYLDYCSEMLSLTSKVAALYAQNFRDPVVISAVNEMEGLTTGLSRKIWQKIMILHKLDKETLSM